MTQEELNKVLERHLHWLRRDCDGWEVMRANLAGANLAGANLAGANLGHANLAGANLACVNLEGANLAGANLAGANLGHANLVCANLGYANPAGANLEGANLGYAILVHANLKGANLAGANLEGAKNLPFIPIACPDTGAFIGWKKARRTIIKLEIPADAKRCSATTNKCRCDKAKVLEIQNLDGSISDVTEISSNYDDRFVYKVGEVVYVKDFCEDRWIECSQGIHFFTNRQSAVEY